MTDDCDRLITLDDEGEAALQAALLEADTPPPVIVDNPTMWQKPTPPTLPEPAPNISELDPPHTPPSTAMVALVGLALMVGIGVIVSWFLSGVPAGGDPWTATAMAMSSSFVRFATMLTIVIAGISFAFGQNNRWAGVVFVVGMSLMAVQFLRAFL